MTSFKDILLSKGASQSFAMVMGAVLDMADLLNLKFTIVSVWRDPKRQDELRARWDKGERDGLRARPANNSKHCLVNPKGKPASEAVDLGGTEPVLAEIGAMAKAAGLKWGGDFQKKDSVHFQS